MYIFGWVFAIRMSVGCVRTKPHSFLAMATQQHYYFCEPFSGAVKFVFVCIRLERVFRFNIAIFFDAASAFRPKNYGRNHFIFWLKANTTPLPCTAPCKDNFYLCALRTCCRPQFAPKWWTPAKEKFKFKVEFRIFVYFLAFAYVMTEPPRTTIPNYIFNNIH